MDYRENLRYPIPYEGREVWPEQQWQWSQDRAQKALKADELVFVEDEDGEVTVNYKQYLKDENGEGKPVLVLWRDMENLDPILERHFLESKIKAEGPFEEVLINGDTATPGVKSLDGLFKRLMEEEEK